MTKFVECPVVDNIPLLADVLYTGQMYTFAVPPNNSSGIAMSDILLGQNHIAGMLINNSFGTDSTNEPVPLETLALPAVPIDFIFFKLKRVNVRKWRERERERERTENNYLPCPYDGSFRQFALFVSQEAPCKNNP